MNLADRLRDVIRPVSQGPVSPPRDGDTVDVRQTEGASGSFRPTPDMHVVAEMLDGECREWNGHWYIVIDRSFPPGHRHGATVVADAAPGGEGWSALGVFEPAAWGGRMLFLDLETTGLAGGAGTYAFLVGCGWFEAGRFRVRQFLLAQYAAERGLLEALAQTAADAATLATYNGKTFDVPLIETRFSFHRLPTAFGAMPHLDMLHPARRFWRMDAESSRSGSSAMMAGTCRLSAVEQAVLGHRREHDVPGFEIPSRYFQYVRSGDARPLAGVLEHNRLDLLSLALLTARAAALLDAGAVAARTAREALGLGRLYQRAGMLGEAHACFDRATDLATPADSGTLSEALRLSAVVSRRVRRYDAAAAAWRALLELPACPPRFVHEASEALAIHHEHRDGDLRRARDHAYRSLRAAASRSRLKAVEHRLARLDRKLAVQALTQPLF